MFFTIETLETHPAILVTFTPQMDFATQMNTYYKELLRELDEESRLVSIVIDLREIPQSLNNIMSATKAAMSEPENPHNYPNVKQVILITDSPLLKASTAGLSKFGIASNIKVFNTIEKALSIV